MAEANGIPIAGVNDSGVKTDIGMVGDAAKVATKGAVQASDAITGTGAGTAITDFGVDTSYQISSDASHSGTTTVDVEVSNDNVGWEVIGSLSVTGASDTDSIAPPTRYTYARYNCTAHGDSTNVVTFTMAG